MDTLKYCNRCFMNNKNNMKNKKIVVIGLSGESVFLNIDHLNENGETIKANLKETEPGGKGYNQAIALGKLGADVDFITVLGNDLYSENCIEVLKEHNVKTHVIRKNISSSYAVIIVDKDANNNVIVYPGASDLVEYSDIMRYQKVIDDADIVLLQNEYPDSVIKEVIEYAYSNGKVIVLNPAPKCNFDEDILKKVKYLTPNEFELTHLKYTNNIDIICTMGSKGVKYIKSNTIKEFNSYDVKALDTTGAGDIFNAGFCYALSKDMEITDAIELAISTSGYSVMHKGVINALPNMNDVDNFRKKYNKKK